MASVAKPTFVLVPGAWCPAVYYEKVVALLKSKGYEAIAIDSLSVGRKDNQPPATAYDDANHVRETVIPILDAGTNVILVGNSYGCFISCESAKGLSKKDREAEGKKGAVTHLILNNFVLPTKGSTVGQLVGPHIPMPTDVDISDPYLSPIGGDPSFGAVLLFGDASEESMKYVAMVQPHSAASFADPLTWEAYEGIETTVMIGEKDLALSPEVQSKAVDDAVVKGGKIRKVILEGGAHVPMIGQAEAFVKILTDVASNMY
ncbi:Alpha/beta hydrolase fold-1 [Dendryphion nanum]|uniref:Alpha/beta hydrolase fold-1 n=1 Tax=Dendryphion nanum TaxID=256645 RepID=A0A9P9DWP8_9PLEO|nr:Alpha/beta hydrolase fold-1 [Dendryphion nanum]